MVNRAKGGAAGWGNAGCPARQAGSHALPTKEFLPTFVSLDKSRSPKATLYEMDFYELCENDQIGSCPICIVADNNRILFIFIM